MVVTKTGAKPLNNDSRTSGHVYAVLYDTKDVVETYLKYTKSRHKIKNELINIIDVC